MELATAHARQQACLALTQTRQRLEGAKQAVDGLSAQVLSAALSMAEQNVHRGQAVFRSLTGLFERADGERSACPRCGGSGLLMQKRLLSWDHVSGDPCWFCEGVGVMPIVDLNGFMLGRAPALVRTQDPPLRASKGRGTHGASALADPHVQVQLYLGKFPGTRTHLRTYRPRRETLRLPSEPPPWLTVMSEDWLPGTSAYSRERGGGPGSLRSSSGKRAAVSKGLSDGFAAVPSGRVPSGAGPSSWGEEKEAGGHGGRTRGEGGRQQSGDYQSGAFHVHPDSDSTYRGGEGPSVSRASEAPYRQSDPLSRSSSPASPPARSTYAPVKPRGASAPRSRSPHHPPGSMPQASQPPDHASVPSRSGSPAAFSRGRDEGVGSTGIAGQRGRDGAAGARTYHDRAGASGEGEGPAMHSSPMLPRSPTGLPSGGGARERAGDPGGASRGGRSPRRGERNRIREKAEREAEARARRIQRSVSPRSSLDYHDPSQMFDGESVHEPFNSTSNKWGGAAFGGWILGGNSNEKNHVGPSRSTEWEHPWREITEWPSSIRGQGGLGRDKLKEQAPWRDPAANDKHATKV